MGSDESSNFEYKISDQTGNHKIYKDFTTLECWRLARQVKLFFYYEVLFQLPPEEKYKLGNQIRKASLSGIANIAEGYGRFYYKESIQFYRISRGSLFELKDHLIFCLDLKYISISIYNKGRSLLESAIKTLNGYIGYVQKLSKKVIG